VYDVVVGNLGRWGEPVFAVAMGFLLDFADQRFQPLQQLRVPSRWFIYGIYRMVQEALDMVGGKGHAFIKSDGSIQTDPADEIVHIYMQKGDEVKEVRAGSRTATVGIRRYVAVGEKRVYYFEAPYELPEAGGSGG
jgi:hypothetical protein